MRVNLILILALLPFAAWANMASPIEEGTLSASPFISLYVDVLHEQIHIKPDNTFETAQFDIEYHIHAHQSGSQIPLLFYASEFRENFNIWLDGKEIQLQAVPDQYERIEETPFSDFSYFFKPPDYDSTQQLFLMNSTAPSERFYVRLDDLKFFEVDLDSGNHVIKVSYTANRWSDRSDWVKTYSFRYALSPAKYWKSFGTLSITLDGSDSPQPLSTNLGNPTDGNINTVQTLNFDALPGELLMISHKPEINSTARFFINISPGWIAILFGILATGLHILAMYRFRKANPNRRFSWVMIVGSILVPLAPILAYSYSFDLIDVLIGPDAGHYHGYGSFFVFGLYPPLLGIYLLITWGVDKWWKA